MNTKPSLFITAGLSAALIFPAFALEAPEDDSPPPPVGRRELGLPEIKLPPPAAKAQERAAFLGVVSGEVPKMLADHLDLKPGEGIVVRSLVPDGPASASGIAVNDVITKVAGQPVGTPLEISNQIAAHQPGEKVTLEVIHKGKPASLEVTLGTRPAEMVDNEPRILDRHDLEGMPRELADRIRDAIQGNIGGFDLDNDEAQLPPKMEEAMRDLQNRLRGGAEPNNEGAGKLRIQGSAIIRQADDQGSVEVKSKDGAKEVTIRDQQGKVTWSGPWDTAQDKSAAPEDIRQRVESLNIDDNFKGGGLRMQMRQAPPPEAEEP